MRLLLSVASAVLVVGLAAGAGERLVEDVADPTRFAPGMWWGNGSPKLALQAFRALGSAGARASSALAR